RSSHTVSGGGASLFKTRFGQGVFANRNTYKKEERYSCRKEISTKKTDITISLFTEKPGNILEKDLGPCSTILSSDAGFCRCFHQGLLC
ncbi:MAG: hypothetical protein K9L83_04235, partial [Deltaproteobacteria bacterium]|nr:hypothetical protein [Deltaproteobacteria bacterium]